MILQNDLENKTILLGVTGGIAAYKTPNLIRLLKKKGANVIVVATSNALNFVTKLTLQTVSNNKVYVDEFDIKDFDVEHISLAKKADILLIAPLSANTLGKIANGIADNLLTSLVLAFDKPVVLCPAMNTNMWQNAIVQDNLTKLKNINFKIIEPVSGLLACGDVGIGKMKDESDIVDNVISTLNYNNKFLNGKNILITAGGTSEPIDCVRFITNKSSGKMGLALAKQASYLGACVHLISTFEVSNPQFQVTQVQTALQMKNAVFENYKNADIVIMAAAVSDFRCQNPSEQKIKKTDSVLTLNLVKNPDILAQIAKEKLDKQIVVGFCAESQNLIDNAKEKIKAKNCDFIVANDISNKNIGFNSNNNEVFIVDKKLNVQKIELNTKDKIAYEILKYVSKNN
ncbi:MAG: bifunctional phosphopantothenoylcysteine decarboxylase/phosphopantothenate--cysteine ligase CoaBC [Candidatus Gastranaerophilales bacterium]|nr:bifunctional phosphopantothenoylcysteine decarboxylase/phosphopantothenate--cysteine ligase CoaBC [Candidatus Gastranaerophilales bacterium]